MQGSPLDLSPQTKPEPLTLSTLWLQFLPLSLSDVTMAFGDPAITMTLTRMPEALSNLAAVGVAKTVAILFESPIIMLLHASNALAPTQASRRALWRFMLLASGLLTALLIVLVWPPIFNTVIARLFGLNREVATRAHIVLSLLFLWPGTIAWRRYFQGLLIRHGHNHEVGRAGIGRLLFVAVTLSVGYARGLSGVFLAGIALMGGIIFEALLVTFAARRHAVAKNKNWESVDNLPTDLRGVWRFYWPLANSMVVVWGGRALMVGIIARASDGPIALAAWPAAWGAVLLISNATRMVQQIVIANRHRAGNGILVRFALTVGALCSALLLCLPATPLGRKLLAAFLGHNAVLLRETIPVLWLCVPIPLLIALQNAAQGFLIGDGRTHWVNVATGLGTVVLLISVSLGIQSRLSGATVASVAMVLALTAETICLWAGFSQMDATRKKHAHALERSFL